MENSNPDHPLTPSLEDRWEAIAEVRQDVASELSQMAEDMPGEGRKYLRSLSRWFQGSAGFEDAIKRPDVLAICLPLLNSAAQKPIAPADITQSARLGFCSVGRNVSLGRRLVRIMLYPILIILAAGLLWIAFSFWIPPQFEEMFDEFGIELPSLTLAVFGFARFVRHWWWILLTFPIGAGLLFGILNHAGGGGRPANISWLDQRLMSTRNALASWAWHLSLLLEAGLSQNQAIQAAGSATGNSWLRQLSLTWAGPGQPENATQEFSLFANPKYQLLDRAIGMPTSPGKIALLRKVATYYWDRNSSIGDWWIHLLVSLLLWIIGAAILVGVLALFMPLIAIVSGLTGGKM